MVSSYTTNKAFEKPANGDYVDTWNVPVNGDFDIADKAFGGTYSVSLTNANVTLTQTNCQNVRIRLTGSLSGNVIIYFPSGVSGFFIVQNATTGTYSVTLASAGGGAGTVLTEQGRSAFVFTDGTNVFYADDSRVALTAGTGITISGTTNLVISLDTPVATANGGTGISSYAIGDLLYASGTTTLSKLADVATGNALISGGVGVAPAWGKIGLTTHVTGTLPVANGGTGITSFGTGVATALGQSVTGSGGIVLATSATLASPTLVSPNLGTPSAATLTNATGLPIVAGTTGTLTVARGGNGLTSTPTNGQIDIGNGSGFTRTTLTAGTGISVTNGAGSITVANSTPLTLMTAQASTSGTAINFTGIPNWVKRITVILDRVSTNGASTVLIQLGSGSYTTSGYSGSAGRVSATVSGSLWGGTGIEFDTSASSGSIRVGSIVINNITGNTWVSTATMGRTDAGSVFLAGGYVSLSGTLDQLRVTTENGTDAFDGGTINVMYEG